MNSDFQKIIDCFQSFSAPWAVCGGWAIDLFVQRKTRPHKDVDIAVFRSDQLILQSFLMEQGWQLQKAVQGELIAWEKDEFLVLPIHNIWCHHPDYPPNMLEVLFSDRDGENFCFRTDFSIQLPLTQTFIISTSGVPILVPEIVLLHKSRHLDNPDYQQDFEVCESHLTDESRTWLRQALYQLHGEHIWLNGL